MNIAVIGAGTRGTGIAHVAVLGGHAVALHDLDPQKLARGKQRIEQGLDRLVVEGSLPAEKAAAAKALIFPIPTVERCAEADFIMECIPETLEIKKTLIEKLDRLAPRTSIITTTTLAFSISVVAAAAQRFPERVIGMHFFEPIPTRNLVELVPADKTAPEIITRCQNLLHQMSKSTVTAKDTPGFIVDRLTTLYTSEAVRLMGEGQTSAETIDKLLHSLGIEVGPFRLIDSIGVDTHLEMTKKLYTAFYYEPRYRPHPLQDQMVQSNRLGRKTKRGFYSYDE